jgi:hypothetical protein
MTSERRPVVDLDAMRRSLASMVAETSSERGPGAGTSTARATARIIANTEIEVRAGRYQFRSDEPPNRGGNGSAPRPLQYFAAGVAT